MNDSSVDDLSQVHERCDDLMAKLKALNQEAGNMPTASAVSTSPFVTPIVTPVHTDVCTEEQIVSSSEVVVTANAVSEGLIDYLTNPVVVKAVENNLGSEFDSNEQFSDEENEVTQPVEATVIINENAI